jgi:hypothetical protein
MADMITNETHGEILLAVTTDGMGRVHIEDVEAGEIVRTVQVEDESEDESLAMIIDAFRAAWKAKFNE